MKKIIKQYDEMKFKPNKSGSGMCDIYETIETNKGLIYKKTNSFNRQAIMNSEAKNCDIAVLYKRLIKGDSSVLNTREGVYLDTENAPRDIIEMNNYSKYIEKYFYENKLLQSVYNSDFQSYFKDYQKGLSCVKKKIDDYSLGVLSSLSKKDVKESKDIKKDSEVKNNENK